MQELLAKARNKLSSLQMQDVYDKRKTHGDVIGVAYCYEKIVITYEDKTKQVFQAKKLKNLIETLDKLK